MAKKAKRRSKRRAQAQNKQNQNQLWLWIGIAAIALLIGAGGFMWASSQNSAEPAAATEGSAPVAEEPTGQDAPAATAPQPLPAEISVDEAYQMYQDGAFVLDVRTPGEWDEYHAPNTTLIPLDELEARVDEVPRDKEIVLVCRSGNRSQVGRDILAQAGFETITSMSGGLKAWRSAGYPIE